MSCGVRLRVVVSGLSPLVVRIVDVPAAVALPLLHRVLLACFDWSGEHLHAFEIRGRSYSDSVYVDAESSRNVTLGSLGLRVGERFCWRYDFSAGWVIDARAEGLIDTIHVKVVSGRRAGPPGWVDGPGGFVDWEDAHSMIEVLDIVSDAIDAGPGTDLDILRDRLWPLLAWLGRDVFDRRRIQQAVWEVCGRGEQLEVPSCESSSKSASTPTSATMMSAS